MRQKVGNVFAHLLDSHLAIAERRLAEAAQIAGKYRVSRLEMRDLVASTSSVTEVFQEYSPKRSNEKTANIARSSFLAVSERLAAFIGSRLIFGISYPPGIEVLSPLQLLRSPLARRYSSRHGLRC